MFELERFVQDVGPFVLPSHLRQLLVLGASLGYQYEKSKVFRRIGWHARNEDSQYIERVTRLEEAIVAEPTVGLYSYKLRYIAIENGDFARAAQISFGEDKEKLLAAETAVVALPFKVQHLTFVKRYDRSLDELACDVGNLRYDALSSFLTELSADFARQSVADGARGRKQLSGSLDEASKAIEQAKTAVDKAMRISKKYMEI